MEEIFDVVDAADRVVGQASRSEVHARGLRHRAAHVLVFDQAGRVYVQRRALTKDCSPGLWDTSAAGHLDRGEDYPAAARRELSEELGVTTSESLEFVCTIEASPDTGWEFIRVFAVITEAPVRPDPVEIIDGRWLAPSALGRWLADEPQMFTGSFHRIWRHWQQHAVARAATPTS